MTIPFVWFPGEVTWSHPSFLCFPHTFRQPVSKPSWLYLRNTPNHIPCHQVGLLGMILLLDYFVSKWPSSFLWCPMMGLLIYFQNMNLVMNLQWLTVSLGKIQNPCQGPTVLYNLLPILFWFLLYSLALSPFSVTWSYSTLHMFTHFNLGTCSCSSCLEYTLSMSLMASSNFFWSNANPY